MQKQNISIGQNKIEQAFTLYNPDGEYRLAVKDIAEVLGISSRMVRGYIWRARHPDRYAARVAAYLQRKNGGKVAVPVYKSADDQTAALKIRAAKRRA